MFLVIIIVMAILGFAIFLVVSKKIRQSKQKPVLSDSQALSLINELSRLGYFKYTDSGDIEELKTELMSSLSNGYISTNYFEDSPYLSKDRRLFSLDGETLYEEGGFVSYLEDMKVTFEMIGLKMVVGDHIEEWDDATSSLNHEISVNGKKYIIFKHFKGYGWGEAAVKFAEMINDQMKVQNIEEKLYLINGGNDGRCIFLTDAQFNLLNKVITDIEEKPLAPKKWSETFKVNIE